MVISAVHTHSLGSAIPCDTGRRTDIDTLRALACIALVSFHVIGSSGSSGLELAATHPLRVLNTVLVDMRMPLFSFLSGLVFVAARRGSADAGWMRWRMLAKERGLLVPMVCVGTLFWLTRALTGQAQQPLWSILVLPYAHFWYLQATFLIIAAFILLVWVLDGRDRMAAVILACGGVAAWLLLPRPPIDLFSITGALRLSLFFGAGYLTAGGVPWGRLSSAASSKRQAGALLLVLVLASAAALASGALVLPAPWRSVAGLCIGLASCQALLLIRPVWPAMAWLGQRSYAIYLFHVFFTAGLHDATLALAPGLDPAIIWPLGVTAGLLGPVLLQEAILRNSLAAHLLLGLPLRRRTRGHTKGSARVGQTA
jgi:peptidoglycan/LPS O-acetylase OafA/YrhL